MDADQQTKATEDRYRSVREATRIYLSHPPGIREAAVRNYHAAEGDRGRQLQSLKAADWCREHNLNLPPLPNH